MRRAPRLARSRPAWIAAALLGVGCAGSEAPRNLLLVSIDTLRPDRLGCYGEPQPTSPAIDALAAEGVLFERALATSPWTLPSHGSLLTGLYPGRHGLRSRRTRLPDAVETLAERLARHGFATTAVVNSHYLSERYAFDRGFDEFTYVREWLHQARPSRVGEEALSWLSRRPPGRFFLFVHYYDVHSGYLSLPGYERRFLHDYTGLVNGSTRQLKSFREGRFELDARDVERLRNLYAASVRQMDDGIRALLDGLAAEGLLRSTLVVLTSDHGEEFLEHGGVLHGHTQYEEVLRVPLILRGPGVPRGLRVATPVSLVDVVPTLLTRLGIPVPGALDGEDLSPLLAGEPAPEFEERLLFSEADHEDRTASARAGRFKLVYDRERGSARLFDLSRDPGERNDAAQRHPERAARLEAELEAFLDRGVPGEALPELGDDETERLRALGYL